MKEKKFTFEIEVHYHLDCLCGETVSGTSMKWAYFKLLMHTQKCKNIKKEDRPPFLRTLWGLFRWKQ